MQTQNSEAIPTADAGAGRGADQRGADERRADDRGVYAISVAAELSGAGVQNMRLYERRGLLRPDRSAGGTRLYSPGDVRRLRRITDLLDAGLNLAGIAMVLDLQDDNTRMRDQIDAASPGASAP